MKFPWKFDVGATQIFRWNFEFFPNFSIEVPLKKFNGSLAYKFHAKFDESSVEALIKVSMQFELKFNMQVLKWTLVLSFTKHVVV